MLKLAEERVLQFKFSDLEGQSYRTSGPPAATLLHLQTISIAFPYRKVVVAMRNAD